MRDQQSKGGRGARVQARRGAAGDRGRRTAASTSVLNLGDMQRRVMDMRGSDTGGMQCCAMSAPLPFSTRTEPVRTRITWDSVFKGNEHSNLPFMVQHITDHSIPSRASRTAGAILKMHTRLTLVA